MNNLAIIYIYSHKDLLTSINYGSIEKYARNIPIYHIHQNDFPNNYYSFLDYKHVSQWGGTDIWYWGSDNLFLYWYLSNPDKRAKNYLILEYDTHACEDICNFFGLDDSYLSNHRGISSVFSIFLKNYGYGYWWFDAQKGHPLIGKLYGLDNFAACSPLCGNLISDDAVHAIIQHLKDNPGSNKLYVETKFATILNYLGYDVLNYHDPINNKLISHSVKNNDYENIGGICVPYNNSNLKYYISFDQQIAITTIRKLAPNPGDTVKSGIFHPIKNINVLWKYFMTTESIVKNDVYKAYFGSMSDAKAAIEMLRKAGLNKILVDNSLCGDPYPGINKKLYIEYEKDGQILTKTIDERGTLNFEEL